MSLRFYFGPSGCGKSRRLYQEIVERAIARPDQKFLVIVPDQFTMQTQKDLVTLHQRGGILNIDVLSFGRLTYRVFDEVGELDTQVLDDTGKSLVLQKVALKLRDQLPTLGGQLQKQGYIHEVKSALSEFMQYGISVEDMGKLIQYSEKRGALVHKLKDLALLYQGFLDYIDGNFITTEGSLELLCRSLVKSKQVRGSVVVFDGFTGFTPIQNQVIQEILRLSEETIICLTLGNGENPYIPDSEQKLFHMTKKTVHTLLKLAQEVSVTRGKDVFVGQPLINSSKKKVLDKANNPISDRFENSPALRALEQNLFRYPAQPFLGKQDNIRIFEASDPGQEVHQAGLLALKLVREKGYGFRDLAFITGDLEEYAPYVESEFAQMGIPCYIDRTRQILLNPMIEYIKSALELYQKDFSYEAVFHYLRSGLSDILPQEADLLEDYCIQTGLRGYRKWSRLFVRKTSRMEEGEEEELAQLNQIRQQFMAQVECLHGKNMETVESHVNRLYTFLVENRVQEKLAAFGKMFREQNQPARAREYAQIYRLVMDLLSQIYELLGPETISLKEFAEILEAGFGEIKVGTIPQNVDRVLVGDMERTRLKQVKALFFLGVNDGNIPKAASKGGIISDMDREFLRESELELAPSPRQQMYIQRLYLYLNMTKPSEVLFLSFVKRNSQGKSLRPAYLIDVVQKLFPEIVTEYPEEAPVLEQVVTPGEGVGYLAEGLRRYVEGFGEEKEVETAFFTLYEAYDSLNGAGGGLTETCGGLNGAGGGLTEACGGINGAGGGLTEACGGINGASGGLTEACGGINGAGGGLTEACGSINGAGGGLNEAYGSQGMEAYPLEKLTQAAFRRYEESGLSRTVAQALYGLELKNSVSRLETYAGCAYRHFLQYGLSLKEREEFGFERVDLGNVFHAVLESFSRKLEEGPYTWFDFPREFGEKEVRRALEAYAAGYGESVLYSSARNEYAISRMGRVLERTVLTLQNQLQKGEFVPDAYEMSFQQAQDLKSVRVSLSSEEKMILQGRIDRVDTAEDDRHVYVKVIDYKSGNQQFDLAALYYGLQLQLVVYMNAALEMEARKHPEKEIVPAAMLYYHIEDPTVESALELDEETLDAQILEELRMRGVVNSGEGIVEKLDRELSGRSAVIPVERKKDGTFSARSSVMTREELKTVSDYVNEKVKSLGQEILAGNMEINPYEKGSEDACTYCPYKKVCGFDPAIPGYRKRELENLSKDEVLRRIGRQDQTPG